MVGCGLSLAAMPCAAAQDKPPAVSVTTGKSDSAVKVSVGASGDVGIDLPGEAAAATEPLSELAAQQLELERQAEEAAARAAEQEAKRKVEHVRRSYERAEQGLIPLSTEQVQDFMRKLELTQEAAAPTHRGVPKGEVRIASLSLDPGVEPPQVNLAAGFVTTINFIDQTGEPWPILDVGIGGSFEVTPTQAGSHVVRVAPLTRVGNGNLSVLLKGLSTPVIFRLASGGSTYHMRLDARVPSMGPQAKAPLIQYRRPWPIAGDEMITMILENAPPPQAKKLKIGGVDARTAAWQMGDKVYVRTPLSLLSPAWNASASSSDGTTVYEVGSAPVLLMSDNGAMIRARLLREDEHDK